jgi:hypothetical protein
MGPGSINEFDLILQEPKSLSRTIGSSSQPVVMRFHRVIAPNSKYLVLVTPAQRGKRKNTQLPEGTDQNTTQRRA